MNKSVLNVVLTGGSNGIGEAILHALSTGVFCSDNINVYNLDTSPGIYPTHHHCDISQYRDVVKVADKIEQVDILINCAGVNYINWIEDTPEYEWDRIIGVNAKGIFNTTKVFIPKLLKSKGTIMNIVSNASHMPMTNSIAYNASKGAAHIMTLQMARELGPKGITVFGISPNRIDDTLMSEYIDDRVCGLRGWTPEQAREYQNASLPAGEATDKSTFAEFIAFILSSKKRHKYMAGTILPYGK